jgi:NAD(P)-dependent dehydrogenase (short-subunit alcohol dehydrogenase family)
MANGTVLLLGGRSEIGLAVAQRLVRQGTKTVVLAARRSEDLDKEEALLHEAGAETVVRVEFDADDVSRHATVLTDIAQRHGPLAVVITAFGILGDQGRAEHDAEHALSIVHTDYIAHVSVLTELAILLRRQRSGQLVVFSSVAGVRVRRANYVYGSAKAGLDGFATGLGDALAGTGVRLLVIRPGFVIGRMTEGMKPAPFSSTPDQVADATVAALSGRRQVVWVPSALRWVFSVFRLAPRAVWRRLPR